MPLAAYGMANGAWTIRERPARRRNAIRDTGNAHAPAAMFLLRSHPWKRRKTKPGAAATTFRKKHLHLVRAGRSRPEIGFVHAARSGMLDLVYAVDRDAEAVRA